MTFVEELRKRTKENHARRRDRVQEEVAAIRMQLLEEADCGRWVLELKKPLQYPGEVQDILRSEGLIVDYSENERVYHISWEEK